MAYDPEHPLAPAILAAQANAEEVGNANRPPTLCPRLVGRYAPTPCGEPVPWWRRADAVYCSERCRKSAGKRAHLDRLRLEASASA